MTFTEGAVCGDLKICWSNKVRNSALAVERCYLPKNRSVMKAKAGERALFVRRLLQSGLLSCELQS